MIKIMETDNVKKDNGSYSRQTLKWFSEPFENDLGVQRPPFQRVIDQSRVETIIESLLEKMKTDGKMIQTGVIHVAIHRGVRYIIDGQHRLAAYQAIGDPYVIMTQVWHVKSNDEMFKLFVEINSNAPVEAYIFNPDLEYKAACDIIVQHVEKEYRRFVKAMSNTGRSNFPNISSQTFRKVLPYIKELKEIDTTNAIAKFEQYNQLCKKRIEKSYLTKVNMMEAAAKAENYSPLYINRDIMKIWSEKAAEINQG